MLHRFLIRQLRALGLEIETPPKTETEWAELLTQVSNAYEEMEREKKLCEKALGLAESEKLEKWQALQEAIKRQSA
jgi:hypothetical protein